MIKRLQSSTQKIVFVFILFLSQLVWSQSIISGPDQSQSQILSTDSYSDFLNIDDAVMTKTPDLGHTVIYNLIDNAQSSIHLMIYHLTDDQVINKLIEAQKRGVEVCIIFDNQTASAGNGKILFQKMLDAGIHIVKSSSGFSISHVKSFSVDKKILFVSTMNFIKSFATMRDYGLTTSEPSLIAEFESVFATDLQNSQTGGTITPPLSVNNLVWSPVNSRDKLTALIDSAKNEVRLTVENITDAYITASLGNAAKRGVTVRMLTPECVFGGAYNNERALKTLNEWGVDTRVTPNPISADIPYMHSKTISVDGQIAFIGSENYSLNSLSYAREFGIIFKNNQAINFLNSTFDQDWEKSVKFASLPAGHCDAFNGGLSSY